MSGDNSNANRYLDDERLAVLFQNDEFLNELRHNKDFITTLHSGWIFYSFLSIEKNNEYLDQPIRSTATTSSQQRRSPNLLSTKPLPLPTPPTVEIPKTPKVRARMLQNVLTQIEQGQTMKSK